MLANWLMSLGLTRDSGVWFWTRLSAVAALIASGAVDILGTAEWLGIHMSETHVHWVTAICVAVLWIGGKYDASPLPGGKK